MGKRVDFSARTVITGSSLLRAPLRSEQGRCGCSCCHRAVSLGLLLELCLQRYRLHVCHF